MENPNIPAEDSAKSSIARNEITWDCPSDKRLTWRWGRQAFPGPLTPLVQSYLPYHTQGWARAARAQGAPGAVRIRFLNGYFYSTWQPVGLTTWEAAEAAWHKAERMNPDHWKEEWLPEIKAELARLRAIDLHTLTDDALSQVLHEALTKQIRLWEIHAHMGSSPVRAVQRLVDWYLQRFFDAPESEPYKLLQGHLNSSVESGHRLWEMARMVTPAFEEALRSGVWDRLPEPFRNVFQTYLDEFGNRTQAVADPGTPTWREDPNIVANLILNYVENKTPDPYVTTEKLAAERETFTREVRAKLAENEGRQLDELLVCALTNYPLLEEHAYWLDQQCVAAIRSICVEFGLRMLRTNALSHQEDLSYLTLEEIILWGLGSADPISPLVAKRKAEHQANQKSIPPDFLGAPPEANPMIDRYEGPLYLPKAEEGVIHGVGASSGVIRGSARVVFTLAEAQTLRSGEILVTVTADPNWTPLFSLASALVTDAGGSLSHGAVIAREYNLPAVVGTQTATRTIKTGQLIEVDGINGLVRLL